jgi:hypothetical protein
VNFLVFYLALMPSPEQMRQHASQSMSLVEAAMAALDKKVPAASAVTLSTPLKLVSADAFGSAEPEILRLQRAEPFS